MNIIIPVGGIGERFKKSGYLESKPCIKIQEKEMLMYVLDCLKLEYEDKIFIIYKDSINDELNKKINAKYNNVNFININKQTDGAVETLLLGLTQIKNLEHHKKCVVMDCDTFYGEDILSKYRNVEENAVFYTKNYEKNPIYSYIEFEQEIIFNIKEKEKISDNANTGVYCFSDINDLLRYAENVIVKNVTFKNEYYTSCLIHLMLKDNFLFKGIELNSKYVFNLGTPEQVKKYIDRTFLFLFDLDGTLVLTDEIYFDVWYNILKEYNIELTQNLFSQYIQGQSDQSVLVYFMLNNTLLKNSISKIKDELF